jgi:hypothetical protein
MNRTLGQDYTDGPYRIQFLKDNCDKVEELGYMKQFTPEEIQQQKDELSEVAIKINDIESERKEAMSEFKTALKPLETQKASLLKNIKTKAEFVREECFKFTDFDDRMVGFYNSDGLLVESRPMRPDEAQRTINLKSGTND